MNKIIKPFDNIYLQVWISILVCHIFNVTMLMIALANDKLYYGGDIGGLIMMFIILGGITLALIIAGILYFSYRVIAFEDMMIVRTIFSKKKYFYKDITHKLIKDKFIIIFYFNNKKILRLKELGDNAEDLIRKFAKYKKKTEGTKWTYEGMQ